MLAVAKTRKEAGIDLIDLPEPKLATENDVLVEVKACGICGSDLEFYLWDPGAQRRFAAITLPMILGHEPAGIVAKVGKNVSHLKVGDRVTCDLAPGCGHCYYCMRGLSNLCDNRYAHVGSGAFARYSRNNGLHTFKIPDDIPFEQAACIEPLGVAVHAVERSHLKAGDFALIIGPGPIGLLTAMVARASGAARVMVAGRATSASRLKLAADQGFTALSIDSSFRDKVLSETRGRGADVVFDCAGGTAAFKEAARAVRKAGEIVVGGLGPEGEFDVEDIMARELTVIGAKGRQSSTWDRAIALVASGTVNVAPIITHVLPLDKAVEGFEAMVNRSSMKVVLVPGA